MPRYLPFFTALKPFVFQALRPLAFRLLAGSLTLGATPAFAGGLTLAVTTSIEASGLLDHLLPAFEKATGTTVRAVVAGSGQALEMGRRGDVDATFTHDSASEMALVAGGVGLERRNVMANDFVLVGLNDDRAQIAGLSNAADALRKIADSDALFLSRGDESGTHKAERRLWAAASIDPSQSSGGWYLETGLGQGANLNMAVARGAYTLTDRGSWIAFGNHADLMVLVEGDPRLYNQYGVVLINPSVHKHINADVARAFADWLTSSEGQARIAAYRIDGAQPFQPNAGEP